MNEHRSIARATIVALNVGWYAVHVFWVLAFIVNIAAGADERFCDWGFPRPEHDAGPINARFYETDYANQVDRLWVAGFVAAVLLTIASLSVRRWRAALLATTIRNLALGLSASFLSVLLAGFQMETAEFCSLRSRLAGYASVAALIAIVLGANVMAIRRKRKIA
jgi:hypothetical protein